jgi:hypothetical protein
VGERAEIKDGGSEIDSGAGPTAVLAEVTPEKARVGWIRLAHSVGPLAPFGVAAVFAFSDSDDRSTERTRGNVGSDDLPPPGGHQYKVNRRLR